MWRLSDRGVGKGLSDRHPWSEASRREQSCSSRVGSAFQQREWRSARQGRGEGFPEGPQSPHRKWQAGLKGSAVRAQWNWASGHVTFE